MEGEAQPRLMAPFRRLPAVSLRKERRDREVSGQVEPHSPVRPVWPSREGAERSRPQEASGLIRFLGPPVAEEAVSSRRQELRRR